MIETAKFLSAEIDNKKVIITGAMLPQRFSNSDASINLGTAIGAVSHINEGVFIAMHGVVKAWNKIGRNVETGKYF